MCVSHTRERELQNPGEYGQSPERLHPCVHYCLVSEKNERVEITIPFQFIEKRNHTPLRNKCLRESVIRFNNYPTPIYIKRILQMLQAIQHSQTMKRSCPYPKKILRITKTPIHLRSRRWIVRYWYRRQREEFAVSGMFWR